MKASSRGLEIEIILTQDETLRLRKNQLTGMLSFSDDSIKRKIPFTLLMLEQDNDNIKVDQIPNHVYFGNCDSFSITLYNNQYEQLLRTKSCGDRFISSGKVLIYQEGFLFY